MTLFLGVLSSSHSFCIISVDGDLSRSFRGVIEEAISVGPAFAFFVVRLVRRLQKEKW